MVFLPPTFADPRLELFRQRELQKAGKWRLHSRCDAFLDKLKYSHLRPGLTHRRLQSQEVQAGSEPTYTLRVGTINVALHGSGKP